MWTALCAMYRKKGWLLFWLVKLMALSVYRATSRLCWLSRHPYDRASGRNDLPSSVAELVRIPLRNRILTNSATVNYFLPLALLFRQHHPRPWRAQVVNGPDIGVSAPMQSPWALGYRRWGFFSTVLPPPNSPSCVDWTDGTAVQTSMISATSLHTGGVNVLLADGSVRFASDSIDSGNPSATPL